MTLVLTSLASEKGAKASANVIIHRLFNIQPLPEFDLTQEALKLAKDLEELFRGWRQQSS